MCARLAIIVRDKNKLESLLEQRDADAQALLDLLQAVRLLSAGLLTYR